jgi:hypothetical protein
MALSSLFPSSVTSLISDYDFVNPFLFQPQAPSYTHQEVMWLDDLNVPVIQVLQSPKKSPLDKDTLTIVFFHGNACDLGHTRKFVEALAGFCKVNVISVEYPGYGVLNNTRPCTSSFLAACTNIVQHIVERMDVLPSRLILYGQSLGGAAALHVAAYLQKYHKMRVGGVITQSAFASVQQMAAAISSNVLGSWLGPLCSSLCVVERLDNVTAVSQLHSNTPLLLMHGSKDNVVPLEHMHMLFDARASKNTYTVIAVGANHNNMDDTFVLRTVQYFISNNFAIT